MCWLSTWRSPTVPANSPQPVWYGEMDAVYLAVALALEDTSSVGLLSFDVRQRSALIPEDGIHLLPAH